MTKADFNYRPNHARSIHVFGEFTDELTNDILSKISELRASGTDPITLNINSPGGIVRCLEIIQGCLTAEDADGNRNRIITVAVGDVASAAASLFTLGNYAIAYPHSIFHFHGMRLSEVDVTMEDASSLATHLLSRNHAMALKLAEAVIARIMHRYLRVFKEFPALKKIRGNSKLSDIECFVACVVKRRVSLSTERLLKRSLEQVQRVLKIHRAVFRTSPIKGDQTALEKDASVYKAVLDYEMKSSKGEWRLNETGIARVSSDYFLLSDFMGGEHSISFNAVLDGFGHYLLSAQDGKKYISLLKNSEQASKFLFGKVGKSLGLFWYFAVVLCRTLQYGENRLAAKDAYWLGIVDEVTGTELVGERAMMEEDVLADNNQSEFIASN